MYSQPLNVVFFSIVAMVAAAPADNVASPGSQHDASSTKLTTRDLSKRLSNEGILVRFLSLTKYVVTLI